MRELGFESIEPLTQAEFAEWAARHERDGLGHYELLNGRVVMTPPASHPHGGIGARLAYELGAWLSGNPSGFVFGASQGFELPSGDTVEPDLAFVSLTRWSAAPRQEEGKFLSVVPDLVVEILSPSTRSRDRGEKKAIYEANGVREYWLVDPRGARVTRFGRTRRGRWDRGTAFEGDESLVSVVLPGLTVALGSLFAYP